MVAAGDAGPSAGSAVNDPAFDISASDIPRAGRDSDARTASEADGGGTAYFAGPPASVGARSGPSRTNWDTTCSFACTEDMGRRQHGPAHVVAAGDDGSTAGGVLFQLLLSMVGGGLLALPHTLLSAGWALGLAELGLSGALSLVSLVATTHCARVVAVSSFQDLCGTLLGPRAVTMVAAVLMSALTLVGCSLVLICSDLAADLGAGLPRDAAGAVVCAVAFLASLPRTMHGLRYSTFGSFLALLLVVGVVVTRGAQEAAALSGPAHAANGTAATGGGDTMEWPGAARPGAGAVLAFAVQSSSFICHINAPRLQARLGPRATRMPLILAGTTLCGVVLYSLFSMGALLAMRGRPGHDALAGVRHSDLLLRIVSITLGTSLVLKMPLVLHPLRELVVELVSDCLPASAWADGAVVSPAAGSRAKTVAPAALTDSSLATWAHAALTLALAALLFGVATALHTLGHAIDILASTCAVLIIFLLPAALVMRLAARYGDVGPGGGYVALERGASAPRAEATPPPESTLAAPPVQAPQRWPDPLLRGTATVLAALGCVTAGVGLYATIATWGGSG